MRDNRKLKVIDYPLVLTREETLNKKPILLIHSFLGKELFELEEPWEIQTFKMIDGSNNCNTIIETITNSYRNVEKQQVKELLKELESYGVITSKRINPLKITKSGNANDVHKAFLDYLRISGLTNLKFPLRVRILLTLRCNMNCIYCYLRSGKIYRQKSKDELTFDQIKKIIDEMVQNNAYILDLSGGEPFLRNDAIDIIKYASDRIPFIYILTNGSFLANIDFVKSLSKTIKNKAVIIQISLDSSDPESSKRVKDALTFQKVLQGIKNATQNNLLVNVNTVVTKSNFHDLDKIVTLSHKLGVKSHTFSEFIPVTCTKETIKEYLCSPAEYYRLQNEIVPRLQKKYPDMLIIGKIIEPEFWDDIRKKTPKSPTYGSCAAFTTDLTIGPDGRVLPCAWFAAFPKFYGPDVTNSSIKEIWENNTFVKKFRNIKIKGKCEKCEFNQLCYKGCFALKYSIYKKLDIPDLKCWYIPGNPSSKKIPTNISDIMLGDGKF